MLVANLDLNLYEVVVWLKRDGWEWRWEGGPHPVPGEGHGGLDLGLAVLFPDSNIPGSG